MKYNLTRIVAMAIFAVAAAAGLCSNASAFELPDAVVTCSEAGVRRQADQNSTVFWKMRKGEKSKVKAINGEFYKVVLSGGKEGYAHNSCVDVTVWARVLNTGAWVHKSPSATADVAADLRNLTWVRIVNRWQTWYEVVLSDRRTHGWVEQSSLQVPAEFFSAWLSFKHDSGYIYDETQYAGSSNSRSRYLQETENVRNPITNMPKYRYNDNVDPSSLRYSIVSYAKGYLGTPYVWGGDTPSGFDCSGFVQYVFRNHGLKLERNSAMQAQQGSYVAPSELLPGDLVFFSSSGSRVNHVGIYIGGGNFIHASSSGKDGSYVRISPLFEGHYSTTFVTARRVLSAG